MPESIERYRVFKDNPNDYPRLRLFMRFCDHDTGPFNDDDCLDTGDQTGKQWITERPSLWQLGQDGDTTFVWDGLDDDFDNSLKVESRLDADVNNCAIHAATLVAHDGDNFIDTDEMRDCDYR